jgi:prepilin-type N-terminal cleavage/methylation domain-containing protein
MAIARKARRTGLTLMELLVVVAILSVVLYLVGSAVFSALGKAQANAERANWVGQRVLGVTVRRATPIRVLFIGNSYTGFNFLPQLIADLAEAAGNAPGLTYDTQVVGGATLQDHYEQGEAVNKIRQAGWDFVVLQEQSLRPIQDEEDMDKYARLFCAEIRAVGAIPLFYMTWARRNAPTQNTITNAYLRITTEKNAEVAPVGMAWQTSGRLYPQIVLYSDDGSHPSPTGSYLAACVFYASIYDKSPQGLPGTLEAGGVTIVDLPPGDAAALQGVAWQTVQQVKAKLIPGWQPAW